MSDVLPVPLAAAAADAATDDEEDAAAAEAAYWWEYEAAAAEELAAWLYGLYTGELLDLYTGELDELRGEVLNRPLRPSPRLDEDGFRSCEILYDSSELARTYRMFG